MRFLHAENWNNDDRTLCGDAFEGVCLPGEEDEPVIAGTAQAVTCPYCIAIIVHCKKFRIRKGKAVKP